MGGKGSGTKKYTPEVHAEIIEALKTGCFKCHAAWSVGINPTTLDDWLERGARGEAPYEQFYIEAMMAIAHDARRNQQAISAAAVGGKYKGDWKAAAWNLEKKHPKLYGRIAELELLRKAEIAAAKQHLDKPYSPWKPPADGVPRRMDA